MSNFDILGSIKLLAKSSLKMKNSLLLITLLLSFISLSCGRPRSVQNFHARYDSRDDVIYINWFPLVKDAKYLLRYKINSHSATDINEQIENWHFTLAEPGINFVRLEAKRFNNNDEIFAQVKPETSSEWGDALVISIAKRQQLDEAVVVDETDLMPPLNFTANVLSPQSLRLEWVESPSKLNSPQLYYIINVQKKPVNSFENSSDDNQNEPTTFHKQIKVEADKFLLDDLVPGENYEITIRSATSTEHVSSTAAIIEITMLQKNEYFEVGNLTIASRFKMDGTGTVNLTWDVPDELAHKITSYDVRYKPLNLQHDKVNESNEWTQVLFSGEKPTAILYNLKSDTEYVLTIKTFFMNNIETESDEFRFHTPRVPANPLKKLEVLYFSETNAIRLQWVLASHILPSNIAGYDIYLTTDKELPETKWRFIPLKGKETEISLDDLLSYSTTYFVKINIRNLDGNVINSPLIYKFTTIDRIPDKNLESRNPGTLSYNNVGNGVINLSWSFPDWLNSNISGSRIFYTKQFDEDTEHWQKISINKPDQV